MQFIWRKTAQCEPPLQWNLRNSDVEFRAVPICLSGFFPNYYLIDITHFRADDHLKPQLTAKRGVSTQVAELSDCELVRTPAGLDIKSLFWTIFTVHSDQTLPINTDRVMTPGCKLHVADAMEMHEERSQLVLSVSVVRNPPGWEVGLYLVGFLVLLGVAGLNIWKLWKSGTFPTPSPFPNFDYRYLQEKYGTSFSEVRQKVRVLVSFVICTYIEIHI